MSWTQAEDAILTAGIEKYGTGKWHTIAALLPSRTTNQVRNRYFTTLRHTIHFPWDRGYDRRLCDLVASHGKNWATVGTILNAPPQSCMERYEILQNRKAGLPDSTPLISASSAREEHKPAVENPVDLDIDTQEAIATAEARMAQDNGRKAQRKLRERLDSERKYVAAVEQSRKGGNLPQLKDTHASNIFDVVDLTNEAEPTGDQEPPVGAASSQTTIAETPDQPKSTTTLQSVSVDPGASASPPRLIGAHSALVPRSVPLAERIGTASGSRRSNVSQVQPVKPGKLRDSDAFKSRLQAIANGKRFPIPKPAKSLVEVLGEWNPGYKHNLQDRFTAHKKISNYDTTQTTLSPHSEAPPSLDALIGRKQSIEPHEVSRDGEDMASRLGLSQSQPRPESVVPPTEKVGGKPRDSLSGLRELLRRKSNHGGHPESTGNLTERTDIQASDAPQPPQPAGKAFSEPQFPETGTQKTQEVQNTAGTIQSAPVAVPVARPAPTELSAAPTASETGIANKVVESPTSNCYKNDMSIAEKAYVPESLTEAAQNDMSVSVIASGPAVSMRQAELEQVQLEGAASTEIEKNTPHREPELFVSDERVQASTIEPVHGTPTQAVEETQPHKLISAMEVFQNLGQRPIHKNVETEKPTEPVQPQKTHTEQVKVPPAPTVPPKQPPAPPKPAEAPVNHALPAPNVPPPGQSGNARESSSNQKVPQAPLHAANKQGNGTTRAPLGPPGGPPKRTEPGSRKRPNRAQRKAKNEMEVRNPRGTVVPPQSNRGLAQSTPKSQAAKHAPQQIPKVVPSVATNQPPKPVTRAASPPGHQVPAKSPHEQRATSHSPRPDSQKSHVSDPPPNGRGSNVRRLTGANLSELKSPRVIKGARQDQEPRDQNNEILGDKKRDWVPSSPRASQSHRDNSRELHKRPDRESGNDQAPKRHKQDLDPSSTEWLKSFESMFD